ncbi:MAG: hypothetical protein ACU0DK_09630 [Pseudooceanicola sp.]
MRAGIPHFAIVRLLASSVKGAMETEYLPRLQVVFKENIPSD